VASHSALVTSTLRQSFRMRLDIGSDPRSAAANSAYLGYLASTRVARGAWQCPSSTINEAATYLGVCQNTFRNWEVAGRIPVHRIQ